jgi:hypothetical protein
MLIEEICQRRKGLGIAVFQIAIGIRTNARSHQSEPPWIRVSGHAAAKAEGVTVSGVISSDIVILLPP